MDKVRLRAACEDRLSQLRLPHRFDTKQLISAAADYRGKPIRLRPLDTLGAVDAPCGIRIETPGSELLYYETGTSTLHQMHILAHEISHIVCDHPGTLSLGSDATTALGLNPTLIQRMSGRTSYNTDDEREAEMMATLIRQRIYRGRELPPHEPSRGTERWEALFAVPHQTGRRRP
ncbi:regulator component [Streptomyces nigrescens]